MTTSKKCYRELLRYSSFQERFDYLNLNGVVGNETFGRNRFMNQAFYASPEWKSARNKVIIRDRGCDLGVEGYEIYDRVYVHHMNPVTLEDLENENWDDLLNPDFLICTSDRTHNAIHFGDAALLPKVPIVRTPGDTCLWR